MSFTRAMQPGQPPQPAQQGTNVGQIGQQAAHACGTLVQALQQAPGVDKAKLNQAAAALRQALMAVAQCAPQKSGQGAPGTAPGGAPPGA